MRLLHKLIIPCCVGVIVLSGCRGGTKTNDLASLTVEPQVLMPDDTVLAWNVPEQGASTEVYAARGKSVKAIGKLPNLGVSARAVGNRRFISTVSTPASGGYHWKIFMHDLDQRSTKLLVDGANTEHMSYPASHNGKWLLVYAPGATGGIGLVDAASGKGSALLTGMAPVDATWVNGTKSALIACISNDVRPDIVNIYRVGNDGKSTSKIWSRPYRDTNRLTCSPDGEHIVYVSDGGLVCESLDTHVRWRLIAIPKGQDVLASHWSANGEKLAVVLGDDVDSSLLFFETNPKRTATVRLDAVKRLVHPLGWLGQGSVFLITVWDGRFEKAQLRTVELPSQWASAPQIK